MHPPYPAIRAITLDLDDTLWPILPAILRAEEHLLAWVREHTPSVVPHFTTHAMRELREDLLERHPEKAYDLLWIRQETIATLFARGGASRAQAEQAFGVFESWRQRVDLFEDSLPALNRLSRRFPILAVTNGFADVQRTGIGRFLAGSIMARDVGFAKPDPRIFALACERLSARPDEVLHVGDDPALDAAGARAHGMHVAWINRKDAPWPLDGEAPPSFTDMAALADWLDPAQR